MVDYSTMSSAAKIRHNTHDPDISTIIDTSLQPWLDLLGTYDMEPAASSGLADQMAFDGPSVFFTD